MAVDSGATAAFADVLGAQAPAASPAQPEDDGSVGWDEPTQAIFLRHLKDEPKTDATRN